MSQPLASWSHREIETIIAILKDADVELAHVTDDPDISKDLRTHATETRALLKAAKHLLKNVRARQEELLDEPTQTQTKATGATARPGGRHPARNRHLGKHQTQKNLNQ